MADLASNTYHPDWSWDGKSYPKTKRSHGPNIESLNRHLPLEKIIGFAPNGYPDPHKLRELLVLLQDVFHMFAERDECETNLI